MVVFTDVVATDLGSPPKKKAAPVIVDLTLSDSDDESPAPARSNVESAHADSSHMSPIKRSFSGISDWGMDYIPLA